MCNTLRTKFLIIFKCWPLYVNDLTRINKPVFVWSTCCRCPPYCSDSWFTSRVHAGNRASGHPASHGHGKRCLYWPTDATDTPTCCKHRLHSTPDATLPTAGQSGVHQTLLYPQDVQPYFHHQRGHHQPQGSCPNYDGPTARTGERLSYYLFRIL